MVTTVTRLIVDYNYRSIYIKTQIKGPWEPQISTIYQNVLNRGEVDFRLHSIPILDSLDYTLTLKSVKMDKCNENGTTAIS